MYTPPSLDIPYPWFCRLLTIPLKASFILHFFRIFVPFCLYGGFFKSQRCRNSFFQIITSPLFKIWKRGLRWNWILIFKTWMRRFRFVYPKIWVHFLLCAFHIADGFTFYHLGFLRIFIHFISLRSLRRPSMLLSVLRWFPYFGLQANQLNKVEPNSAHW